MSEFAFTVEELPLLASILMDVAEADDELVVSEVQMIATLLCDLSGLDELSDPITEALLSYDPEHFDLTETCRQLQVDSPQRGRQLMALVGSVIVADGVFHEAEDERLARLAPLLGHDAGDLADFRKELVLAMADLAADPI